MDNTEIKKANRKAMPKFIFVLVVSLLAGGGVGYLSAKFGLNTLSDSIKNIGEIFGIHIAPWLLLVLAVILPIISILFFMKAKKLLSAWDGEDEVLSDAVDAKLSVILWISSAVLIVSFFLIAASYSGGVSAFDNKENIVPFFVSIFAFFGILIEAVVIQQKCVDMVKKKNPEKTASVYDIKFQKKWLDSCDEAEKFLIGKCAFKAFGATNVACVVLAVVFAIGALVFEIGFLPSLAVCLIWIVNQSAYYKEAMKYSKVGKRIS